MAGRNPSRSKAPLSKAKLKPQRARNSFARANRKHRQDEAKARQAAYDALTTEQKIAKLDAGGYAAVKQRIKLLDAFQKTAPVLVEVAVGIEAKGQKPNKHKNDKKGHKNG